MPLPAAMPLLAATVLCADRQGGAAASVTGSAGPEAPLFRDSSRPLVERVADLVGCLTLSEKPAAAGDSSAGSHVWDVQEITFSSARDYANPYADVVIWVLPAAPAGI